MAKRIRFIDDEEDVRFVIKTLLEKAGYEVDLESEHSCLENLLSTEQPDLYLLDRHFHGADLLDTCQLIKSNPDTGHIPVVMISADPRTKLLYTNAKADACIDKPFKANELLEKLAALLAK